MSYIEKGYVFLKGRENTIWKPPAKGSVHYVPPEQETWEEWLDRATWEASEDIRISFNELRWLPKRNIK